MNFQIIGLIAGAITTASFAPQVYKCWKTKHTRDLSWIWLIMITIGMSLWLVYGLLINEDKILLISANT